MGEYDAPGLLLGLFGKCFGHSAYNMVKCFEIHISKNITTTTLYPVLLYKNFVI